MAQSQFDLIAAGHIVNEMIYFPDRTIGPVLRSPPAYSLVASAMQGTKTGLVTKIGSDFPENLLETFKCAGVDTQGTVTCPTSSRSELIYDKDGNKEIKFPSRADYIKSSDVPEAYKHCRMMYVCTMEDDVQLDHIPEIVTYGNESAIDLGGYGGAKAGLDHLCRVSADEMGRFGVRVNSVQPGIVATELMSPITDGGPLLDDYLPQIPLGRVGEPGLE